MTERFASLKFNPKKATRPLDLEFPELFRHPEWVKLKAVKSWRKVVSYILFLYSKDTDLIHEHPSDLKARKDAAAFEAEIEREKNGKWPDEIQDIMDIRNETVFNAIMVYLKFQKHQVWMEITVTEQELYEFQGLRFMAIDAGKKKKPKEGEDEDDELFGFKGGKKEIYAAANEKDELMEACDKRIKKLENLYSQFYGDSKKELMEAEFAEQITPENAERIMLAEKTI